MVELNADNLIKIFDETAGPDRSMIDQHDITAKIGALGNDDVLAIFNLAFDHQAVIDHYKPADPKNCYTLANPHPQDMSRWEFKLAVNKLCAAAGKAPLFIKSEIEAERNKEANEVAGKTKIDLCADTPATPVPVAPTPDATLPAGKSEDTKATQGLPGPSDSQQVQAASTPDATKESSQQTAGPDGGDSSSGDTYRGYRGVGPGGGGGALGIGGLGTHGGGRGGRGGFGNVDLSSQGKAATDVLPGKVISKGTLTREQIERVMQRAHSQVRYCYEKELQKNPNLYGKIVTFFVISGTGKVGSAEVKLTTMNSPEVEACILSVIKKLRFPEPAGRGTVDVTYPFLFKTGGAG
ncbi:MAG: AgmX/PglI C-terminal domain-containing protein [Deltaproteobacteria bacterium]|nr:AgmX/PglI C-terminal domain-containing protein [Deltaproteobacteria bacterium]